MKMSCQNNAAHYRSYLLPTSKTHDLESRFDNKDRSYFTFKCKRVREEKRKVSGEALRSGGWAFRLYSRASAWI